MKKLFFLFLFMIFIYPFSAAEELNADDIFDIKQNAFALYNTNHKNETLEMLNKIPNDKKDAETYLILSNLKIENNEKETAIEYLTRATEKDPEFYKAYYNLGCIYMEMRTYILAKENFELAVKYSGKKNAYAYYNLASAEINLGEYKKAKKNLIKAIYLKNDEKNFYYNLAYVDKKLGKEKDAKKILDFYNATFVN